MLCMFNRRSRLSREDGAHFIFDISKPSYTVSHLLPGIIDKLSCMKFFLCGKRFGDKMKYLSAALTINFFKKKLLREG